MKSLTQKTTTTIFLPPNHTARVVASARPVARVREGAQPYGEGLSTSSGLQTACRVGAVDVAPNPVDKLSTVGWKKKIKRRRRGSC